MRAMVLHEPRAVDSAPLSLEDVDPPVLDSREILVRVEACGICRTDLHVVEGELPSRKLPVVPGHQIVGTVAVAGTAARRFKVGDRVGVAWLRSTDGTCLYCRADNENLCRAAEFTGYSADGGYADLTVVREDFAYAMPRDIEPAHAAPLLCAGIIGYRALRRSEIKPGQILGLYGFGASAHVSMQIALYERCEVYVVTRDERHQALARSMGATWVGGTDDKPPKPLNGAIDFTPAGETVPMALEALDRGGTLSLAGIFMSQIPPLDYEKHLFCERNLRSVTANTRTDGIELLKLAAQIPIQTHVETFSLEEANDALRRLKHDQIQGAGVLLIG